MNKNFLNSSAKLSGAMVGCSLALIGLSAPGDAASLGVVLDLNYLSPAQLSIPGAGFGMTGNNSFTVTMKATNNNNFDVLVNKIRFDLYEDDSAVGEDGMFDYLTVVNKDPQKIVAIGATETFIIDFDVSNSLLSTNRNRGENNDKVLGTDQLEFLIRNVSVQGTSVPEPLTFLGTGAALGAITVFKKYLKRKKAAKS